MRPRQRHTTATTTELPQIQPWQPIKRRRVVPRPVPSCLLLLTVALFMFCYQLLQISRLRTNNTNEISEEILDDITRALQSPQASSCSNATLLFPEETPPNPPASCRKRWYRTRHKELPVAELVIAANSDTCGTSVLRTVALALIHAKSGLLTKVWVTTSASFTDDIVDALQSLPQTKILYRPELHSITDLRNEAAEYVRSPVIVFLTPGVLPTASWLEPLLGEIAEDKIKGRRATLALPAEPPRRRGAPPPTVGHDWALRRLEFARVHTSGFVSEANAAYTPLLPYSDFAVATNYWNAIGGYEDGSDTELALRVWQCGASIATIPCSRVERPNGEDIELRGPVKHLQGSLKREDRLRVARRWMGPYAILAEFANGVLPNSTQLAPGEEGQCPGSTLESLTNGNTNPFGGYREYMGVAFPEMQPSAQIMLGATPKRGLRAWGKLRLAGRRTCVSLVDGMLVAAKCERASVLLMSRGGFLMAAPRLTATCITRKDGRLVPMRCDWFWKEQQIWELETRRETSLFTRINTEPRCLTAVPGGKLSLASCLPERENRQTWVWQYRAADDGVGDDNGEEHNDDDDDEGT